MDGFEEVDLAANEKIKRYEQNIREYIKEIRDLTKELAEAKAENVKLRKMLSDLLECPRLEDEATRTSGFDHENEEHRIQLVYSVSCSYDKIYRACKLLTPTTETN